MRRLRCFVVRCTASARRRTSTKAEMSACKNSAGPPPALLAETTCSPRARSRPCTSTRHPSWPSVSATTRPTPSVEPVMSAVFPFALANGKPRFLLYETKLSQAGMAGGLSQPVAPFYPVHPLLAAHSAHTSARGCLCWYDKWLETRDTNKVRAPVDEHSHPKRGAPRQNSA